MSEPQATDALIERLREEWEVLGLMSYHGAGSNVFYADLARDDIEQIRERIREAAYALEALTREHEQSIKDLHAAEAALAEAEQGKHICFATEEGAPPHMAEWRPCPASLCEGARLIAVVEAAEDAATTTTNIHEAQARLLDALNAHVPGRARAALAGEAT